MTAMADAAVWPALQVGDRAPGVVGGEGAVLVGVAVELGCAWQVDLVLAVVGGRGDAPAHHLGQGDLGYHLQRLWIDGDHHRRWHVVRVGAVEEGREALLGASLLAVYRFG